MGQLNALDVTGDTKITWDAAKEDEVKAAKTLFDQLIKKGYRAFSVKEKGDKDVRMETFQPEAEKIILIPKVIGG